MWAPLQTAWARMTRLAGLAGLAGSASRALKDKKPPCPGLADALADASDDAPDDAPSYIAAFAYDPPCTAAPPDLVACLETIMDQEEPDLPAVHDRLVDLAEGFVPQEAKVGPHDIHCTLLFEKDPGTVLEIQAARPYKAARLHVFGALWGEDGEIKMSFVRTAAGFQVKTWTSMAPAGVVELCPSSLLPYASSLAMHMHIYPLAC